MIAAAAFAFEYNQLQPKNHFKSVPVVNGEKTNTQNNVDNPVFNILLIGSDERPGQNIGHSDTMMLVHADLNKNKYYAVSIPRDSRVHLDGYGYTKLTSVQYIMQAKKGPKQGVEAAVKAVSELTGVPINYYVETNFEGFQSMVDAVGGINMNLPVNVKIGSQTMSAGTHFFDGKTVTSIVRERHSLSNGDYGRQQLQLEALKGIAKSALNPSKITNLPSLIKSLPDYIIATNMSNSDMLSLGLAVKDFNPNKQLTYQQLHGVGQKLYDDVLKAKNDQIVINQQEIKEIIAKDFNS